MDSQRQTAGVGRFDELAAEKANRLLMLLEEITLDEFLGDGRLCLHGGTALNLFIMDAPRLSLDVDLNYIGRIDREEMLEEKPLVHQALLKLGERLGQASSNLPAG